MPHFRPFGTSVRPGKTSQGENANTTSQKDPVDVTPPKRIILHNFKNTRAQNPQTVQIEPQNSNKVSWVTQVKRKSMQDVYSESKDKLAAIYLPADYPESVAKGYLPFTIMQNAASISITAMSFLSTQSLFVALGGTTSQSQMAAAAYTWVLKDGIGQLGGILFASRYGSNFDEDIKKWRFMSMLALNISIYIEIMTLAYPHLFLALASIANVGKNICFLLAAASRASINVRFAKRNNMGDISGKSVSQFTTSSLIGMAIGSGLSQVINISSIPQLLPTFAVLSAANLVTSYLSAKVIDENYLNNQRANLLFNHYFESGMKDFPNVKDGNEKENFILPNFMNMQRCKYIKFGENQISHVLTQSKPNYFSESFLNQLSKEDRNFAYHVRFLPRYLRPFKQLINNGRVHIIHMNMKQDCSNEDVLKAYYFARLLDIKLLEMTEQQQEKKVTYYRIMEKINQAEHEYQNSDLDKIHSNLESAGWSTQYIYLDPKKNRYSVEVE